MRFCATLEAQSPLDPPLPVIAPDTIRRLAVWRPVFKARGGRAAYVSDMLFASLRSRGKEPASRWRGLNFAEVYVVWWSCETRRSEGAKPTDEQVTCNETTDRQMYMCTQVSRILSFDFFFHKLA